MIFVHFLGIFVPKFCINFKFQVVSNFIGFLGVVIIQILLSSQGITNAVVILLILNFICNLDVCLFILQPAGILNQLLKV